MIIYCIESDDIFFIIIYAFFHKERDQLWSTIKNNILNPDYYRDHGQVSRVSMLLYRPPGKSTLAYHTVMCLNRNLVSVELQGTTKINVYSIIQCSTTYKSSVFAFEEFDILVKNLYNKEVNNEVNNPTEFSLRDLLELFQGPVPHESTIIFATTNKYDEINKMCSELFRPGRLTPVYFGYADPSTIQNISEYFFNKK